MFLLCPFYKIYSLFYLFGRWAKIPNYGNMNQTWANSTATTDKMVVLITPVITWSNPADIVYGTALSNTQLNASASVPGTFVYTPSAGTVLGVGTHTLKVDFTPTDNVNYKSAYASVQIHVITPAQKIQQIASMVQNLNLNKEQANSLIVKLNAATKNLNAKNTKAAISGSVAKKLSDRHYEINRNL